MEATGGRTLSKETRLRAPTVKVTVLHSQSVLAKNSASKIAKKCTTMYMILERLGNDASIEKQVGVAVF